MKTNERTFKTEEECGAPDRVSVLDCNIWDQFTLKRYQEMLDAKEESP